MNIHPILILLLLGHVLGDFYCQTSTMAKRKNTEWKWLLMHSGVYLLCMAAIFIVATCMSYQWVLLIAGTGAAHLTIDRVKNVLISRTNNCRTYCEYAIQSPRPIKKPSLKVICMLCKRKFIIDQLLHVASLIVLWRFIGQDIALRQHETLRSFIGMFGHSPRQLAIVILGLLWILMPVGILIEKGDIWSFNKDKSTPAPSEKQKGAGKMIGYLERTIVFFLLTNGQFAAIAFVIAAKSAIRFKEIEQSTDATSLAEYYIIGTLISMISVFIVAFLLGIISIG